MKTRSAIAMAVCCFSGLAQADLVVDLNAATMIPNSSAAAKTEFLLNTSVPQITGANLSGYTGPDLYIGVGNTRTANAIWQVHNTQGTRVRFDDVPNQAINALYLYKPAEPVEFQSGARWLNAASILIDNAQNLSSAVMRFVIRDGGQFYASQLSANFVDGQTGSLSTSWGANPLNLDWYRYNPESNIGVGSTLASPTFENIDFVGYWLRGVGNTAQTGFANFGVEKFSAFAEVIPEPATLGLIAAFGGGILFIRRRFMI